LDFSVAASDSTSVSLSSWDGFPVAGASCTDLGAQKVAATGEPVGCFPATAGAALPWGNPTSGMVGGGWYNGRIGEIMGWGAVNGKQRQSC